MNRREFLHAAALAGTTAGVPAVAALGDDGPRPADGSGHGSTHPQSTEGTPNGTSTATPTPTRTETPTASPTETPTATPTEAAATPTSGWEPTGHVAIEGATEAVVSADGKTTFVAVGEGFAVVDVSDPADPTVIERVTDISPQGTDSVVADAFDLKYDDGELLLAGPAGYHPDAFRGIVRFDVRDPAAPTLVDAFETTFPVHNCYLRDGFAYLTGNDEERNPLVVVDVADGTEVARWSVLDHEPGWADISQGLRTLHDLYVHDDLAYLAYWDAGTWILDVSDPGDPAYVADIPAQPLDDIHAKSGLAVHRERLEPPGNVHSVGTDPSGTLLAVGKETWNSNAGVEGTTPGPGDPGGPSGIDLYDVAEPADPAHLASIDPPPTADPNIAGIWTTAHNFDVGERYLYSSWYQGGVKVHDLADPTDPEEVRYFRRSSESNFWTAQLAVPGETVVASSRYDPSIPDVPAGLYTFPDVPRSTPTATDDATTRQPSPTTSPAPASPTSDTPPGGQSPPTTTDGTTADTGVEGPGFGPVATLAGLGVAALRFLDGGDPADDDT